MKRQCGPRKKHKLDYCVIGQYLRQFCTTTNDNDLTDTGPYGQTATSLFWSNSIKNRKHLQVVWKENRGNVQNEGELVSTNPVKMIIKMKTAMTGMLILGLPKQMKVRRSIQSAENEKDSPLIGIKKLSASPRMKVMTISRDQLEN